MYKIASQNLQRRVDFIAPADLAGGHEIQSPRELRENYKRALRELDTRIVATEPGTPERKALGMEKRRLCDELAVLPNPEPIKADLGELLIDEMRQMLPLAQYRIAVRRAQVRFEAGETKDEMHAERRNT